MTKAEGENYRTLRANLGNKGKTGKLGPTNLPAEQIIHGVHDTSTTTYVPSNASDHHDVEVHFT